MTDAERQKHIIAKLDAQRDSRRGLDLAGALRDHSEAIVNLRKSAADEIERLSAEVEAMVDSENQTLLKEGMLNHDLNEEIKYQHGEIERLGHKVYELQVELREAEASVDIQRDFVEADVYKLQKENERLAAENDWLRNVLRAAQIGLALTEEMADD